MRAVRGGLVRRHLHPRELVDVFSTGDAAFVSSVALASQTWQRKPRPTASRAFSPTSAFPETSRSHFPVKQQVRRNYAASNSYFKRSQPKPAADTPTTDLLNPRVMPTIDLDLDSTPFNLRILDILEADYAIPTVDQLPQRFEEVAGAHLLTPDASHRKSLELWASITILHMCEGKSKQEIASILSTALAASLACDNSHLAFALVKHFVRFHKYVPANIPLVLLEFRQVRLAYLALKRVETVDLPDTAADVLKLLITQLRHTGAGYLAPILELIIRAQLHSVIASNNFETALIRAVTALPLMDSMLIAQRWISLKDVPERYAHLLQLAALSYHRKFDELVIFLEHINAQPYSEDAIQHDDAKVIFHAFTMSGANTLTPIVELLPRITQAWSSNKKLLLHVITTLTRSLNVEDKQEKVGNFQRAQMLTGWLATQAYIPPTNIWCDLVSYAPTKHFQSTIEQLVLSLRTAVSANAEEARKAIDLNKIFHTVVEKCVTEKNSTVALMAVNTAGELGVDPTPLWPIALKCINDFNGKLKAVKALRGKIRALPAPILEAAIEIFFRNNKFGTVVRFYNEAAAEGIPQRVPFGRMHRMYLTSCEILGLADLILGFQDPRQYATKTYSDTLVIQKLRSLSNMARLDLVRQVYNECDYATKRSPRILTALMRAMRNLQPIQTDAALAAAVAQATAEAEAATAKERENQM